MREILFRSKRTDNGERIEGCVYRISEKLNPFIMLKNRHSESYQVFIETVGQYTVLAGSWNGSKGESFFERECLLEEQPVFRCIEAAIEDDKKNNCKCRRNKK